MHFYNNHEFMNCLKGRKLTELLGIRIIAINMSITYIFSLFKIYIRHNILHVFFRIIFIT